jgi:hypothetical protein
VLSAIRGALLLATAVALLGCATVSRLIPTPGPTPPRALGPNEIWVPWELWEPVNGTPVACAGVGFEGEFRLHGSALDPRLTWMTLPDGARRELAWPLGYSARFSNGFELLDDHGHVVGREGARLVGGCGTPREGIWSVELQTPAPPPSEPSAR